MPGERNAPFSMFHFPSTIRDNIPGQMASLWLFYKYGYSHFITAHPGYCAGFFDWQSLDGDEQGEG